MESEQIEAILGACERALFESWTVDLRRLGFWRAVEAIKRRPEWVERYADQVAAIDRAASERAVRYKLPASLGTAAMALGAGVGLLLVAAAFVVSGRWRGLFLLAGTGALVATTHDLAHLLVGRAVGIRFSHWFVVGPNRPQPGLKIDYASYLRTPPRARAWMHASGALVTKAVPFLLLGVGAAAGTPAWALGVLAALGLVQIGTDLLFSVRSSDWKRFRREMQVAREIEQR